MEETGYGIFYYEETTQFVTTLSGNNYVVHAVLTNPTEDTYTCHIRLNGVVKQDHVLVKPGEERQVTFSACIIDGSFVLSFLIGALSELHSDGVSGEVYLKEIDILPEPVREKREKPHIFLVSDSTVQSYEKRSYPQTGWGQVFYQFFQGAEQCAVYPVKRDGYQIGKAYELPGLVIENHAIAGRSARSFYDEGRLDRIMEVLCPGDFMFVQFAHNDDNALRPNRYIAPEEFPDFLRRYVDACGRRGAQCVLVTPVTMMVTDEKGRFQIAFGKYREKMMELAEKQRVPLLDLAKRSTDYLNEIGLEESRQIYLWAKEGEYPDGAYAAGVSDRAHLQEYGARVYADLVVKLLMEYQKDDRLDVLKKLAAPREISEIQRPKKVSNVRKEDIGKTSEAVTNFVVQEISLENGRGSFLLNWNQMEGAVTYQVYARKKGEPAYQMVRKVTREEKDAYATLPFSADAGLVWEYYVEAVLADGGKGGVSRVAEVDLRM